MGVNLGDLIVPTLFLGGLWFLIDRFTVPRSTKGLYKVIRCKDSDTIVVKDGHGKEFTLRLWGLDGLEMDQGGEKPKKALENKILGKYVEVLVKEKSDKHGRISAQVFYKGKDVGSWLVSHRWAYDYRTYSKGYYSKEEKLASYLYFWRGIFRKKPWKHRYDKKMGKNIKFSVIFPYFCAGVVITVLLMFIFNYLK